METTKKPADIAKEILSQIYLFNTIFDDYLQTCKEQEEITKSIRALPADLDNKLKLIVENILSLDSQLMKISDFTDFYNEHYKFNNIEWTHKEKDITELLAIAVHVFITKIKLNKMDNELCYFEFSKICSLFSFEIIEQMFQVNKGVIVWKIVALVSILINPSDKISAKLRKAISYSIPKNIYSLHQGILITCTHTQEDRYYIQFNTKFVKPFLTSYTILTCFKQIINEALKYNGLNIKVKRKELKVIIDEYLTQDLIVFVKDFPQYGLTLADCSIIILIQDNDYPSLASVMLSIYHEMTHLLYRKVSNTSFFRRSFDETQDSGKKVEQLLIGEYDTCHKEACYYILNINNYDVLPELFKAKFYAIENNYNCIPENNSDTYTLYKEDSTPPCCILTISNK